MSDRSAGSITIGGKIKDLDALVTVILDYGLGDDWITPFENADRVIAYISEGGQFFCANELAGGSVEILEAACQVQGLVYRADWDGYSGVWVNGCCIFDGEREWEFGTTEHGGRIQVTVYQLVSGVTIEQLKALDNWTPPKLELPNA